MTLTRPALLLLLLSLAVPQTAGAVTSQGACTVSEPVVSQMAQLVNAERRASGLPPLKVDAKLNRAAQAHACDMAAKGYFDHVEPNGSTPKVRVKRAGFRTCLTAENISLDWKSPERAMQALMVSPGHRANILRRGVTALGIGYVPRQGNAGPWFVQVFAKGC